MNLSQQITQGQWRPVLPPAKGEDRRDFRISMLLPGFTNAYHMHTLQRCQTTIAGYRAEAMDHEPELRSEVTALAAQLSPADGMMMARLRGSCWMPYWSRLAITYFRKLGHSQAAIASAFECGERTVYNIVNRTVYLSPDRQKTIYQLQPPSRKTPKTERTLPSNGV